MQIADKNMMLFFPTPIWEVKFTDFEPVNQAISEELSNLDLDQLERDSIKEFGINHTFAEDRFITVEQAPSMQPILDFFMGTCASISNQLGWNMEDLELYMTSYWLHATEAGGATGLHSHLPALLSGVYYVTKPPESGDLVFTDFNPFRPFAPKQKKGTQSPLGSPSVTFAASEGTMFIFPGWLQHKVGKNRSNSMRVSISFNATLIAGTGD